MLLLLGFGIGDRDGNYIKNIISYIDHEEKYQGSKTRIQREGVHEIRASCVNEILSNGR